MQSFLFCGRQHLVLRHEVWKSSRGKNVFKIYSQGNQRQIVLLMQRNKQGSLPV